MNKKTMYTGAAAFLLLLFAACDMANSETALIPSSGGKAEVRVVIGAAGVQAARTVAPGVALQDVTAWELRGGKSGSAETTLLEFSNGGDGTVYLETGSWSFTLKGYKDGALILSRSIAEQNISLGSPNILDFVVSPVLDGEGTVSIVIELPGGSGITEARIFRNEAEAALSSITPIDDRIVFEAAHAAGDYYFSVELYKDGELYGVVSEVVQVRANLRSEKTYSLTSEDLNLTYIITYHKGDGETETGYYRYTDADITLASPPSHQDYTFNGWYETADFSGGAAAVIPAGSTGNKDFYARWTIIQYTVTFEADGGSPATQIRTVNSGASLGSAMPSDPTLTGYGFGGWYTSTGGGGTEFTAETTVSGDRTVYARWKSFDDLSLDDVLTWISGNATNGGTYTITLKNDETIAPRTLSYDGKQVGITIKGGASERTVSLSTTGSLFTVGSGVTLTLDNNVTLRGRSDNTASLVSVGGTLVMNTGSRITGNTASSSYVGGGVSVASNGTFTMNGGVISGNSSSHGGGVYVGSGTFTMSGGEISGNTASYDGGGVYVGSGTFTMSSGEISGNSVSTYCGGGVYVGYESTFTMSGGEISGNSSGAGGGGVYVYNTGTFTMSGGEISGNTASSVGGGVYVYGTFTKQTGGVIYGSNASSALKNTASGDDYGHAVYVDSVPKVRNTTAGEGVTLDSAVSGSAGGWETVQYTVTFDADGGSPATQTRTVNSGDSIGASNMPDTPVKSGYDFGGWYTSSGGGGAEFTAATTVTGDITVYARWGAIPYTITFDADGGSPATQTRTVNSGASIGVSNMPDTPVKSGYDFGGWYTSSGGGGTEFTAETTVSGDRTVYARWGMPDNLSLNDTLTWISNNAVTGDTYTITLKNDETIVPRALSYGGKQVGITIKGGASERTVSLSTTGSLFTVGSGVTLTLDNNVTLRGQNNNDALVRVGSGGKLEMNSGSKITGNTNSSSYGGGGVYVGNSGTFTMKGGTIRDNTSLAVAGGVYVADSSTFTMKGGEISSNTATSSYSYGGGVYVADNGTFTISGGTISSNNAYGGGGVCVSNSSTFTMKGGTISGNNASYNGGGVSVSGGFTMSDGTISDNTAASFGGGVFVYSNGMFTKQSGGVIYGSDADNTLKNTASGDGYGHAVYVGSSLAKKRNTTADTGVTLDSAVDGSTGGWE